MITRENVWLGPRWYAPRPWRTVMGVVAAAVDAGIQLGEDAVKWDGERPHITLGELDRLIVALRTPVEEGPE